MCARSLFRQRVLLDMMEVIITPTSSNLGSKLSQRAEMLSLFWSRFIKLGTRPTSLFRELHFKSFFFFSLVLVHNSNISWIFERSLRSTDVSQLFPLSCQSCLFSAIDAKSSAFLNTLVEKLPVFIIFRAFWASVNEKTLNITDDSALLKFRQATSENLSWQLCSLSRDGQYYPHQYRVRVCWSAHSFLKCS